MNSLEVRVMEVTPAIVKFNFDEMMKVAKEIKKQYENLAFEEGTVKEGKATVAEMKKIQKSINDFKIKTKKELTESVTTFESQCKQIISEFDEPINFIQEQLTQYETKRIAGKQKNIDNLIARLKEEADIEEKFWKLEQDPKWTNKTVGLGEIDEAIRYQINQMVLAQNAYVTKLEVIQTQVELANAKLGLNVELAPDAFYYLADSKESAEIKEIITRQAEAQKQKEKDFAERSKQEAERKANADADARIKEEQLKSVQSIAKVAEQFDSIIPQQPQDTEKIYERTITIKGSKAQLQALKNYMEQVGIEVV